MYFSFWPALYVTGLLFYRVVSTFLRFSFLFFFLLVSLQTHGFLFIPYMISRSDCNSHIVLMILKFSCEDFF